MSPDPARAQCPFCMARVRLTKEGVYRQHEYVPRRRRHCPGSHRAPEAAKAAKREGDTSSGLSGRPDKMRPEDIF